jgi:hypothetical protein
MLDRAAMATYLDGFADRKTSEQGKRHTLRS